MMISGGGGGNDIPDPGAVGPDTPILALVCLMEAETHLKNCLKASGDMSFMIKTLSVTRLSICGTARSPQATAMILPGRLALHSSAAGSQRSVGSPSVKMKISGFQSPF